MPLNFPSSPSINEVYSSNGYYWIWNGVAWKSYFFSSGSSSSASSSSSSIISSSSSSSSFSQSESLSQARQWFLS